MVSNRYKQYIRSPAWAIKREQALRYYGRKCYACGSRRGPIQIHHITYVRLYRESMRDLRPLCVPCHREVGALHWKMGKRKPGEVVFAVFLAKKKAQRAPNTRK